MIRRAACALLLACAAIAPGCRSTGPGALSPGDPLPLYADIVDAYNRRAERLGRIWARAVVQVRYPDEDGRTRTTQGEGHLQVIQPDRLALSVGKLGEVYFWLGGDDERFWVFELPEQSRVSLGRHENVGHPCARDLNLPVHPLDLIDLLGVTALPETLPDSGEMAWTARGGLLALTLPSRAGVRRVLLDPATYEPRRVELRPSPGAPAVVFAELEQYASLVLRDDPIHPRIATRIVVTHPESDAEIRMTLAAMEDGRSQPGRLADPVFRFDTLLRAYRPEQLEVLDAGCPRPALPRGSYTPGRYVPESGR